MLPELYGNFIKTCASAYSQQRQGGSGPCIATTILGMAVANLLWPVKIGGHARWNAPSTARASARATARSKKW